MSVCRGCGREIRWIKTKAGKAMPVDEPFVHFVPAGGPDTFITGDGRTVRGRKPTWQDIESNNAMPAGYVPHWPRARRREILKEGAKHEAAGHQKVLKRYRHL